MRFADPLRARSPFSITALGLAAVLLLAVSATAAPAPRRPLMRFPDVRGDTVVFVHGEDIWSVSAGGGVALRLTIHEGEERHPRISPDGRLIAFSGQYEGNTDVYVMNVWGGEIRRVTYHPGNDEVVGWHPTSGKILFRSARNSYSRFERLFLISPDGSGLEEVPLDEAAIGSFSADGTRLAYTRLTTEDRTWKRYRGGMAPDLWLYDLAAGTDRKLTDFDGAGRLPIWLGGSVYFSSDRDGTLNLYACDVATGRVEQVTHHHDYDVRRPAGSGDRIVYQLGGSLRLLDVRTREDREVPVEIRSDVPQLRPTTVKLAGFITAVEVSPSGARVLIGARGELLTVPKEHGPTRNLTRTSGVREKDAVFSPDGARIAYVADAGGEYNLYVMNADGHGEPVRLTDFHDGYRHTLRWSPDSSKIAFADHALRVCFVDVKSRQITEVDRAEYEPQDVSIDVKPIADFAWSPDSRYLAYSKMGADLVSHLWIHDLADGQHHDVSSGLFNDFQPVFSRDGEHLFFVSNRRFDPTFDDFEWQLVYKRVAGIYCLTLRRDGPPLLPLQSDEEKAGEEKSKGAGSAATRSSPSKEGADKGHVKEKEGQARPELS